MLKRLGVSICSAMFLLAIGPACLAQSNPFNGSWKEEPSTFQYTGPTYSVATDAQGYTITRDGKAQPKTVCDGKPQKRPEGEMLTCIKTSTGYALSATKDGKPVEKAQISLSADGKSATRKFEIHPPDGAPFTMTLISRRISGGPGLAGEWRESKFTSSQDNGILSININGGTVAFKETDSLKPVTCKLDGSATKDGMGGSMSMRLADSHTLKVTYKDEKGEVRRENTFVLSADGKKITETDITPAPSPSKMSVAFHKMT
jgi:hypothetical protein